MTIGQSVQVTNLIDATPLLGVAERTDTLGQLIVRDAHGISHRIAAGDVTLRQ
jgi:biotin-(acetyl-CoA carboxylase) ligase